ncbi:protein LRATD1 [Macrotis lagotis]|uniref:protein LRATD1 n=1 Tax=Macrotis lagotis TaxID=92651 RepID=UPI003D69D682
MGNQLDRMTHLSYSELPTGDPSGVEQDELRVGVAYFFSDEEEDADERGQADRFGVQGPPGGGGGGGGEGGGSPGPGTPSRRPPRPVRQPALPEAQCSAFRGPECIFSKGGGGGGGGGGAGDLGVYAASALPALCQPGDLLELLWLRPPPAAAGEPPGAPPPPPHWAVYVGGGRVIHLHRGEIRQDSLYEAGAAHAGRVVSGWYRYRPLVAELVVQNACGHLGLKSPDVCWPNSESFAAWCRFGKREFKAGGELPAGSQPPQLQYYLKVHLGDGKVHTARFHSLEDLIREKRRLDAGGTLRVIQELAALADGKE